MAGDHRRVRSLRNRAPRFHVCVTQYIDAYLQEKRIDTLVLRTSLMDDVSLSLSLSLSLSDSLSDKRYLLPWGGPIISPLSHFFLFFSSATSLLETRRLGKTEYPRPSFLIYIWLGSLERNGWRLVYRARVSSRDDRYVAGLSLGTDILISFAADVSRGLR